MFLTNFLSYPGFMVITCGLERHGSSPMAHLRCIMNGSLHKAPLYRLTKRTQLSPQNTGARPGLKTTNQPVLRNSHSFISVGTARLHPVFQAKLCRVKNKHGELACMMFPGITLPSNENNARVCTLASSSLRVKLRIGERRSMLLHCLKIQILMKISKQ